MPSCSASNRLHCRVHSAAVPCLRLVLLESLSLVVPHFDVIPPSPTRPAIRTESVTGMPQEIEEELGCVSRRGGSQAAQLVNRRAKRPAFAVDISKDVKA